MHSSGVNPASFFAFIENGMETNFDIRYASILIKEAAGLRICDIEIASEKTENYPEAVLWLSKVPITGDSVTYRSNQPGNQCGFYFFEHNELEQVQLVANPIERDSWKCDFQFKLSNLVARGTCVLSLDPKLKLGATR